MLLLAANLLFIIGSLSVAYGEGPTTCCPLCTREYLTTFSYAFSDWFSSDCGAPMCTVSYNLENLHPSDDIESYLLTDANHDQWVLQGRDDCTPPGCNMISNTRSVASCAPKVSVNLPNVPGSSYWLVVQCKNFFFSCGSGSSGSTVHYGFSAVPCIPQCQGTPICGERPDGCGGVCPKLCNEALENCLPRSSPATGNVCCPRNRTSSCSGDCRTFTCTEKKTCQTINGVEVCVEPTPVTSEPPGPADENNRFDMTVIWIPVGIICAFGGISWICFMNRKYGHRKDLAVPI